MRGSPRAGAFNEGGGRGKIGDFRTLSRHISETVQDMTKVVIDQSLCLIGMCRTRWV